jgi:hypothetical protein
MVFFLWIKLGVSWVKVISARKKNSSFLPICPLFMDRCLSYLVGRLLACYSLSDWMISTHLLKQPLFFLLIFFIFERIITCNDLPTNIFHNYKMLWLSLTDVWNIVIEGAFVFNQHVLVFLLFFFCCFFLKIMVHLLG